MQLIADSGSTKTEWRLIDGENIREFSCRGINPYFNTSEQIRNEVLTMKIPGIEKISSLVFYGAGITGVEAKKLMMEGLSAVFSDSKIELEDDLTAACRALFGKGSGIACIIGTGSNSAVYVEGKIKEKVPALGYILGDEGSGANIGIRFLNALLKKRIPDFLAKEIMEKHQLSTEKVLQFVYKEPLPNRYLASFTRVVMEYIEYPEIERLVSQAFSSFIEKNIYAYKNIKTFELGFVGSVAWHFREILFEVLKKYDLKGRSVLQDPVENLVNFHQNIE